MTTARFFSMIVCLSFLMSAPSYASEPILHIGPEFQISSSTIPLDQEYPAVAYNTLHNEYLVVWHNNRPYTQDIACQRVADDGTLLSYFFISTGVNCKHPDVVYNPNKDTYLVVWSQFNNNPKELKWEIYGRVIDWDRPGNTQPYLVAEWPALDLEYPKVALGKNGWTGKDQYMVVWQTTAHLNNILTGIGQVLLNEYGKPAGPQNYATSSTSPQSAPTLVYHPGYRAYLVAWEHGGGSDTDIHGASLFVDANGNVSGAHHFLIYGAGEQLKPHLVVNDRKNLFLLLWMEEQSGLSQIVGQHFDMSINAAPGGLAYAHSGTNDREPAAAFDPETGLYLTAWNRDIANGVSVFGVAFDGESTSSEIVEIAHGGFGEHGRPAVASGGHNFLVAQHWFSWAPGADTDIVGNIVEPEVPEIP